MRKQQSSCTCWEAAVTDCWALVQAGLASGPGLLPKAVQKMWRGLVSPEQGLSPCRAPSRQGGSSAESVQLETSYLLYVLSLTFTKPVQCGCKAAPGETALNSRVVLGHLPCLPQHHTLPCLYKQHLSLQLSSCNQKNKFLSVGICTDVVQIPCPNRDSQGIWELGNGYSLKIALRISTFSSSQHTKLFTRTTQKSNRYRKSELWP